VNVTPSQTVGPFYGIGLPWPGGPYAVAPDAPDAIWLRGTVYDGAGEPVPDALIETWQPDAPTGRGFARCGTEAGEYAIRFVKPGPVPGPDGTTQAPHLAVSVFARGLLDRVITRVYFDDEAGANETDPVLASAGDRRATLISVRIEDGYRFDIRLQGDDETVFLDV
jgi:protocatechuate 3,4-dioxygenase alpha subunit